MRRALAVLAAAGLTLAAAACGGSPAGPQASTQREQALRFSSCMRSHGVASFPDPSSSGSIPKVALAQLAVSSSRFQSAQSACRHLLPNGGTPTQAAVLQVKAEGLHFAQCVRTHGVPNFPDPGSDGRIPDPATAGIDQGSPKFEAANRACGRFRPPYMPSNAAYASWARTHGG